MSAITLIGAISAICVLLSNATLFESDYEDCWQVKTRGLENGVYKIRISSNTAKYSETVAIFVSYLRYGFQITKSVCSIVHFQTIYFQVHPTFQIIKLSQN